MPCVELEELLERLIFVVVPEQLVLDDEGGLSGWKDLIVAGCRFKHEELGMVPRWCGSGWAKRSSVVEGGCERNVSPDVSPGLRGSRERGWLFGWTGCGPRTLLTSSGGDNTNGGENTSPRECSDMAVWECEDGEGDVHCYVSVVC